MIPAEVQDHGTDPRAGHSLRLASDRGPGPARPGFAVNRPGRAPAGSRTGLRHRSDSESATVPESLSQRQVSSGLQSRSAESRCEP
jgi:hypothetical protein